MLKRGTAYKVNLFPVAGSQQGGIRPCVVISDEDIHSNRRTAVVIPLSSSPIPAAPIVVSIPSGGVGSVAICDQIRAVDKNRIGEELFTLSLPDMTKIEYSLKEVLSFK
jgi:mRNA interferase MazF